MTTSKITTKQTSIYEKQKKNFNLITIAKMIINEQVMLSFSLFVNRLFYVSKNKKK